MEVVVLEKETLARVPCGKREFEPVSAAGMNPRRAESIAICLDMDLAEFPLMRPRSGKPRGDRRAADQDEQGGDSRDAAADSGAR